MIWVKFSCFCSNIWVYYTSLNPTNKIQSFAFFHINIRLFIHHIINVLHFNFLLSNRIQSVDLNEWPFPCIFQLIAYFPPLPNWTNQHTSRKPCTEQQRQSSCVHLSKKPHKNKSSSMKCVFYHFNCLHIWCDICNLPAIE